MPNIRIHTSPFRSALSILAALVGLSPSLSAAYTVTLSHDTLQAVDGFGISAAWSGGEVMRLPEPERSRVLGMFFTDQGAAMSIIRMRVVPKTDADFQNQIDMAAWAKAKGISRFYATVWDVPGQFLDGSQRMLPERFGAFADYIAAFVKDMADAGIPIGWIGIQNEPDNGPKQTPAAIDYNQYTVHYYRSKAELRDFSIVLKKVLASKGLSGVKLLGPECMGWEGSRELTKSQFETAEGTQALDVIATHDYWGAERDADMDPVRVEMAGIAKANHKHIWQTEYSRVDCLPGCAEACYYPSVAQDPAKILTQADFNMRDGLEMANYLYKDFSKANASAWLFWWTHNPNKGCGNASQGIVGMHNSFNGLAILKDDQTFFFPKRFHALSHYMRFVRPGSYRLKLTTDGETAVHPLAFWDPVKDQVVVVAYNNGNAAASLSLQLNGFESHIAVKHYRTTQAADMNVALQEARTLAVGQAYAADLPGQSISTFVFDRSALVAMHGPGSGKVDIGGGLDPHVEGGIKYVAAAGERVSMRVKTLQGRLVAAEVRAYPEAGEHRWDWRGACAGGCAGNGVYQVELDYGTSGRQQRMLLLPLR